MMKKVFSNKVNRYTAITAASAILLSFVSMWISGTLASKDEKEVVFENPAPGYYQLEKGETITRRIQGGYTWKSGDTDIAKVNYNISDPADAKITGVNAGKTVISVGTMQGDIESFNYQVSDPSKIASYVLNKGNACYIPEKGGYFDIDITTSPEEAKADIKWESMNDEIAIIDEFGRITATADRGAVIIIGEFTDKWGQNRHVHYMAAVGVNINTQKDVILQDLLDRAKEMEEDKYTAGSWQESDLPNVIIAGETILNNSGSTDGDIQKAIDDLVNAMNIPVLKADKSELSDLVLQAKEYDESDYSDIVWSGSNIEEAIYEAEAVIADPDAEQEHIDAAIDKLISAMEVLSLAPKDAVMEMGTDKDGYPLKWQVLDVDPENEKILVITTTVAAECLFNSTEPYPTWRNSNFRAYFNDTFYNDVFSQDEREKIILSEVATKTSYNKDDVDVTQDYLFPLNEEELMKYWPNDRKSERIPKTTNKGNTSGSSSNATSWGYNRYWLRNPRLNNNSAAYIDNLGSIAAYTVIYGKNALPSDRNQGGVRPAMWLDLRKF